MRAAVSENVYPLLVLSDIVVFPHTIIPLLIENEKTAVWVSASFEAKEDILVCCRKRPEIPVASEQDIHRTGVRAHILQLIQLPDGALKVFIEGKSRQLITRIFQHDDMLLAEAEPVDDVVLEERRAEALRRLLVETFQEYCESYSIDIHPDMIAKIQSQEDPGFVSDIIVSYMDLKTYIKQEILEEKNIDSRLSRIYDHIQGELDIARIQTSVKEQVRQR
ncbi:MAG: LON peptidase substrate-binding domain-containing protein, partial [Desulfomonilia bacterium]